MNSEEKIKICKCSFKDLRKVYEIELESFDNPYPFPIFVGYLIKYSDGFLIAKINDHIVGYIIGIIEKNIGTIVSIAVKKDYRKKGIGKKLLDSIIEYFKSRNVSLVNLQVRIDNYEAISFYEKNGFKKIKVLKNYYSDGCDAFLMEKKV
ncbi:MAG: ribosomal protein S18-alanine N-acetyltransferase [Candidatus Methanomethylicaceae archaeon]